MNQGDFFLQWDATPSCNLRCSHCYHNFQEKAKGKVMTKEEAFSMIDDLVNNTERWGFLPFLHYSGGEPLLRKDLFEIAKYAKKLGVEQRILTNGTLLTSDIAKRLSDANITRVQISVDGKKDTHNKVRGFPWAYDKAMEGIHNASSLDNIVVNISTTLMQSNKDQMEDIIINSYNAGAKKIGFQSLVPSSLDDPEFIGSEGIYELFKEIHQLRKKYYGKILVLETEVLWNIFSPMTKPKEMGASLGKYCGGCGAGWNGLSILSDGTVYPCRRLPIDIGNVLEDGINKIFMENDVMNNLREFSKMDECGECDKVTYCRGCRAIAYAVTGDYMGKDPMCFNELKGKENDK